MKLGDADGGVDFFFFCCVRSTIGIVWVWTS